MGHLLTCPCLNKLENLHEWSTPNPGSNLGPLQPGTQDSGVTPRHQISLTFFISILDFNSFNLYIIVAHFYIAITYPHPETHKHR